MASCVIDAEWTCLILIVILVMRAHRIQIDCFCLDVRTASIRHRYGSEREVRVRCLPSTSIRIDCSCVGVRTAKIRHRLPLSVLLIVHVRHAIMVASPDIKAVWALMPFCTCIARVPHAMAVARSAVCSTA